MFSVGYRRRVATTRFFVFPAAAAPVSLRHFSFPLRSKQRVRFAPFSVVVRTMFSSHTTGVELPLPGKVIFQAMFESADQVVGKGPLGPTPFWSGPRHEGQFSAEAVAEINKTTSKPIKCFIINLLHENCYLIRIMITITHIKHGC